MHYIIFVYGPIIAAFILFCLSTDIIQDMINKKDPGYKVYVGASLFAYIILCRILI